MSLGTDGYGRSDDRPTLRRFFETDAPHVVVAVLSQLANQGHVAPSVVVNALQRFDIDTESPPPWTD